jgi:outer membrane biosynthesis protein TonB
VLLLTQPLLIPADFTVNRPIYPAFTMRFLSQLALLALPVVCVVADKVTVSQTKDAKPIYNSAQEAFRDLLNALPEESLHVALHDLAHFKDGVFESDRNGVERVHRENPPLATKLIVAAVQDLRKRQSPPPTNGTVSSSPAPNPPQTSDAPPQTSDEPEPPKTTDAPPKASDKPAEPPKSSEPPAIQVPVTITQTNSKGEATVVSSVILSQPTASAVITSTRVQDGTTEVVTETKPAVVVTVTDSDGKAFETTSAVDFAPTPGQKLTKTDSKGSVFVTTYTPDGGRVSSVKLITTTNEEGAPMIITSYTYVEPAMATASDGSVPTGTQGRPGLQSQGAAVMNRGAVGGVIVGGLFAGLWI